MSKQPEALRLADALVTFSNGPLDFRRDAAAELHRLHASNEALLKVCKELAESAAYWSEYDVPVGIVDRLRYAIKQAEEQK